MNLKKLLALGLALVLVFALVGCTKDQPDPTKGADQPNTPVDDNPAKPATDLNVGVFYYNYGDTYIASVRTALDAALDGKGIKYQDYDGNNNQGTQNDAISTALANGTNHGQWGVGAEAHALKLYKLADSSAVSPIR